MSRYLDKQKAIKLRLKGFSYSEIRNKLNVGKGTLSAWLSKYPLGTFHLEKIKSRNMIKVERFRDTMKAKRDVKHMDAYEEAKRIFSRVGKRELLIGGLFLYWAEGSKTKYGSLSLTNTDPDMLLFFIKWLGLLGFDRSKLKVNLHLYLDMNIKQTVNFWSEKLSIPLPQFRRPYIKKSKQSELTYKSGIGMGTCSVIVENTKFATTILMALKYLKEDIL